MNLVAKEVSSSAMPADLPSSSEDQIKTDTFMQKFQIDNVQKSNAVICKTNVISQSKHPPSQILPDLFALGQGHISEIKQTVCEQAAHEAFRGTWPKVLAKPHGKICGKVRALGSLVLCTSQRWGWGILYQNVLFTASVLFHEQKVFVQIDTKSSC